MPQVVIDAHSAVLVFSTVPISQQALNKYQVLFILLKAIIITIIIMVIITTKNQPTGINE